MRIARSSVPAAASLVLLASGSAVGRPAAPEIPASLRPWSAWVLESDEGKNAHCPARAGEEERVCAWPARLALSLTDRGGSFSQEWTLFRAGFVELPGDKDHWPRQVKIDGRPGAVIDHEGTPQISVPLGHHTLTGGFLWDNLPESLAVPAGTGLLALTVKGATVRFPMRENDGRVFLGKRETDSIAEDSVDISVYRKLTDSTPLELTTRLVLGVSGKSREVVLGRALPAGFEPTGVDSRLPLRIESDGRLRLQARPGQWTIDLHAHRVRAEKTVTRPIADGLWKEGDEVWAFEAVPDLRTVRIEGPGAIDPAQTMVPDLWKSFPTYAVAPGATLTMVEERRGDAEPAPERLSLERTLWLDSDGGAWSIHDALSGEFTRAWRIEVGDETRLGRLAVDGKDQFLTRVGAAGRVGVEIRSGRTALDCDSRIDNRAGAIPVTSFLHEIEQVSARVNLPLGWDLLHATGADHVAGSWVERWSLGDLVLLLILLLALGKLYGLKVATLGLAALGITLLDPDAPSILWLLVIAAEVAARAIKPGRLLAVARVLRAGVWVMLGLVALPFAIDQARFALHPANAIDRAPMRFVQALVRDAGDVLSIATATRSSARHAEASSVARDSLVVSLPKGEGEAFGGLTGSEDKTVTKNVKLDKPRERLYALKGPKDMPAAPPPPEAGDRARAQLLREYDPSIVVQTGEGLPRQAWRTASLSFSGPVGSDRRVHLYLVPPWLARVVASASALLPLLLAWALWRRPVRLRGTPLPSKPLFAGLIALALLAPLSAFAQGYPSQEMLDELKKRLLEPPDCTPTCAAMNEMVVNVSPAQLRFTLNVSTAMPTAVALPGDAASWTPAEVRVGGKPATALGRSSNGQLWIALDAGIFAIELAGPLPARESIQIPLPMRLRRATFTAQGFEVSGIHEDGAVDENIGLARLASGEPTDLTEVAPTVPPYLRVERTLLLGLKWEAHTRVVRATAPGTPVVIEIPLLPGEAVTTANIRTDKGHGTASMSLGPTETEVEWQSTLTEAAAIHLRSDPATASRWSEIWRADVSPLWHATFSGIPPIRPATGGATHIPEWRPWPGEEVHIAVEKPGGAGGQTKTLDASRLEIEPSLHNMRMLLELDMRSSQSITHVIALPEAAEKVTVMRDHAAQMVRREGRDLVLTVPPGKHNFSVAWQQPTGLSTFFRPPAVDLRLPSTNSTVNLKLVEKPRWILWLAGPSVGPTVNYWAAALLIVLAAILLVRTRLTPLKSRHWLILGLGLAQAELLPALAVPLCLLALGLRAKPPGSDDRPLRYNVGQVLLVALVLAALGIVVNAVDVGLRRAPDMMIAGNGATPTELSWYRDRVGPVLSQPTLVSFPMWAYRACAVVWALWLVMSVLRWSTWIWACFRQHGLWRTPARPLPPPPPSTS
jgi:hypothetical protein